MTVWILLLFVYTTFATTRNPPWKKPEYETMQNITEVVGNEYTTYFVYEGTFYQDVLIQKPVVCLIMRTTSLLGGFVVAYRKYRKQVTEEQETMDLYLTLEKDRGYHVYNYMELEDADEQEGLGAMHLVYTDYALCSLFYYDKTGDYELWLYNKPDDVATPCELLLALLWDKSTHVYYTKNCTDTK
uniref:Putative salivary lipocalin n=1 Tax=Ixodes ricinus TaxID=34613 RepID=A0A0K8RHH5_IXORI